jgi:hypothetical protein
MCSRRLLLLGPADHWREAGRVDGVDILNKGQYSRATQFCRFAACPMVARAYPFKAITVSQLVTLELADRRR